MRFRRTTPSPLYRILRLRSEDAVWEVGLNDYHHGLRLGMGKAGRPPSVMDFCLGRRREVWGPVLSEVLRRLEPLEEAAEAAEIDRCFPWSGMRPDLAVHLEPLLAGKGNVFVRRKVRR